MDPASRLAVVERRLRELGPVLQSAAGPGQCLGIGAELVQLADIVSRVRDLIAVVVAGDELAPLLEAGHVIDCAICSGRHDDDEGCPFPFDDDEINLRVQRGRLLRVLGARCGDLDEQAWRSGFRSPWPWERRR
jgi:hypothetical protein